MCQYCPLVELDSFFYASVTMFPAVFRHQAVSLPVEGFQICLQWTLKQLSQHLQVKPLIYFPDMMNTELSLYRPLSVLLNWFAAALIQQRLQLFIPATYTSQNKFTACSALLQVPRLMYKYWIEMNSDAWGEAVSRPSPGQLVLASVYSTLTLVTFSTKQTKYVLPSQTPFTFPSGNSLIDTTG